MNTDHTEKLIIIVGKNKSECCGVIKLVEEENYTGIAANSIPALEKLITEKEYMAVLIDIDTVLIGNRELRTLTLKYPESPFLCMSNDKYHPELEEAICYHIYACINKPINSDELFFLLRSIRDDNQ